MAHKTLEKFTERAKRTGSAGNDKWVVIHNSHANSYKYYHYNTLVLHIQDGKLEYYFGIGRSDAEALTSMCYYHDIHAKFTFRPVNGGFMRVA